MAKVLNTHEQADFERLAAFYPYRDEHGLPAAAQQTPDTDTGHHDGGDVQQHLRKTLRWLWRDRWRTDHGCNAEGVSDAGPHGVTPARHASTL